MRQQTKDTLMKFFGYSFLLIGGYSLLFFGGFVFLIGIAMWIEGEPGYYEAGRGIAIVSLILIIPGAVMAVKTRRIRSEKKSIDHVVQLVKSYRKISIDLLAEKAGLAPPEVEKLLSLAMNRELIRGKMDRTTREYYIDEAGYAGVRNCPSCGVAFNGTYLAGDTVKCTHCGNIHIAGKGGTAPPPPAGD